MKNEETKGENTQKENTANDVTHVKRAGLLSTQFQQYRSLQSAHRFGSSFFLSVSLVLGDLCVDKIDLSLERFVLMNTPLLLSQNTIQHVFLLTSSKHEHFLSTFTPCWVHLTSRVLIAVTRVGLSLAREVYHSNNFISPM